MTDQEFMDQAFLFALSDLSNRDDGRNVSEMVELAWKVAEESILQRDILLATQTLPTEAKQRSPRIEYQDLRTVAIRKIQDICDSNIIDESDKYKLFCNLYSMVTIRYDYYKEVAEESIGRRKMILKRTLPTKSELHNTQEEYQDLQTAAMLKIQAICDSKILDESDKYNSFFNLHCMVKSKYNYYKEADSKINNE